MKYFIIEHPTRGWYLGSSYEWTKKGYVWVPRFAYSILSTDKKVKHFYSEREVNEEITKKLSEKVKSKCKIRERK